MVAIPMALDGVDERWLTEVLSPEASGAQITLLEQTGIVRGSNVKARYAIEWNDVGSQAGLPTTVTVKANFADHLGDDEVVQRWHQLHMMLNACEARFYREFAPTLDVRTPGCYAAMTDTVTGESIVVLEDLVASGHTFVTYDKPLGPDMMAKVIEQLAILHSSTWDDPVLVAADLRDGFAEGGMLDAFTSQLNWDQQMARPRGELVPTELRDRELVDTAIRRVWDLKRSSPTCLVHGDPHVGNIFVTSDGEPGLLDWPLSTLGTWSWDLGYNMASSMTIEDRRAHERDLMHHYLETLVERGCPAPDFDAAWLAYRRFSIWGFLAVLTPGENIQSEGYNSVVGERHAVAAVDLGALEALGLG